MNKCASMKLDVNLPKKKVSVDFRLRALSLLMMLLMKKKSSKLKTLMKKYIFRLDFRLKWM